LTFKESTALPQAHQVLLVVDELCNDLKEAQFAKHDAVV
jgi:hypothetical protein